MAHGIHGGFVGELLEVDDARGGVETLAKSSSCITT
jgi:hypothetical protein